MKPRKIKEGVFWLGAVDWERRLFDSLIPLPDGTSYNAYLIKGETKVALIDSVDPAKKHILLEQLKDISSIDYVVSHHTEQDHSGTIPDVLAKYPEAKVVASPKGKLMLIDHLCIDAGRIIEVKDGEKLDLGGKILEFIHTPWVHWPETMCTYLAEEKILFSCDFFGSHIATSELFAKDKARVYEAAKRYYAEIMMPFRGIIKNNISKLEKYDISMIAPSHGPIYNEPEFITKAYQDWISDIPWDLVVLPYISMHGSTKMMVDRLVTSLVEKGIEVMPFDLSVTDIGKLAMGLVDAATIVIGTPTVHIGPHPLVAYAANLANIIRPKVKYATVIGSYGWSSKAVEKTAEMISNLKVEILEPVLCKGFPKEDTLLKIESLAESICQKHKLLLGK